MTPPELVDAWLRLWNGESDVAESLIAPDFRMHAAMLGATPDDAVPDREALRTWIATIRSVIDDLVFTIEVGPLVDGDRIALRWLARGHYVGGFPGATASPGTPIAFTGTDLLRAADGRIAEYWLNSDTHVLLDQLAVRSA